MDDRMKQVRSAFAIFAGSVALAALVGGCSGGTRSAEKRDREVRVSQVSGPTTESGEQATLTVVLNGKPKRDVVIDLASSDEGEGIVSPSSLTFTSDNYEAPQTVTVSGVDDDEADGNQIFKLTLTVTSDDDTYAAAVIPEIPVTNLDDETAGVRIGPASGPTTEAGATATVPVRLQSRPASDVLLIFGASDFSEASANVQTLTFTPDNWNAPQDILVTGLDDDQADGAQDYLLIFQSAASEDPRYAGLPIPALPMTNLDNDTAGIVFSTSSIVTDESESPVSFDIVLLSRPASSVQVTLNESDSSEADLDETDFNFTPSNWNVPQTVTVFGDNDTLRDGDMPFDIFVSNVISIGDSGYAGLDPGSLPVVKGLNRDDDSPAIRITPLTGATSEEGNSATFTVVLGADPTADVVIPVSTTDAGEAAILVPSITFTGTNWDEPQTITVKGVEDFTRDGHQPYQVIFGAAQTSDVDYSGMQALALEGFNIDDGPIRTALVFDDGFGTFADDALLDIGYTVVLTSSGSVFDATIIDDTLEFVFVESSVGFLTSSMEANIIAWASSGGALVLSYWDLENDAALQSALEVVATNTFTSPRLVSPATDETPNLFSTPNTFTAPLLGADVVSINGSELALSGSGKILAEYGTTPGGPGAIAYTNSSLSLVFGFAPDDFAMVDTDGDEPDIQELYENAADALLQVLYPPPAFSSDFESDNGGLVVSGDAGWAWGTPSPHGAFSGTEAWDTVLSGNYSSNRSGCLTIDDVLIQTGAHWTMRVRYELENTFDFMTIENCDSTGAACVELLNTSSTNLDYELFDFDLSAFGGQTRDLRWCLTTDGSVTFDGISVDDVVVGPP